MQLLPRARNAVPPTAQVFRPIASRSEGSEELTGRDDSPFPSSSSASATSIRIRIPIPGLAQAEAVAI